MPSPVKERGFLHQCNYIKWYEICIFHFCDCCFQESWGYVMYKVHTVSLTHWDALEQLPVSCTDGQNIYRKLYVFWMRCIGCICSPVCYWEHLNTWPLIKVAPTAHWCSETLEKRSAPIDHKGRVKTTCLPFPHRWSDMVLHTKNLWNPSLQVTRVWRPSAFEDSEQIDNYSPIDSFHLIYAPDTDIIILISL